MLHLLHPAAAIEASQARLHRLPVGDHVGDTGRHPQVVLQHDEAIVRAHDVGAADRHPRAVRRRDAAHLWAVLGAAPHHLFRNDAVRDRAAFAVDVAQESVQGEDALGEARFELPPLGRGQNARKTVDRDDPLVRFAVPIDREGDALVQERARDPFLNIAELRPGSLGEEVVEGPAVCPRRAVGLQHLVVELGVEPVVAEVHPRGLRRPSTVRSYALATNATTRRASVP